MPAARAATLIDLWPRIVRRGAVPADAEALLVAELAADKAARDRTNAAE